MSDEEIAKHSKLLHQEASELLDQEGYSRYSRLLGRPKLSEVILSI